MTKKAVIVVGISGSGKSTVVKEYPGYQNLERDKFRSYFLQKSGALNKQGLPYDPERDNLWSIWKWKWEDKVTEMWNEALNVAIGLHGVDIIITDTNLNKDKMLQLKSLLESSGYEVEVKVLDTPLAECIERDKNRVNTVGEQVIYSQYMKLIENYDVRKRYVPNPLKPTAILVDIDGTLAHMNNKRGPFEWDKVHVDDVDEVVKSMVNHFQADHTIIILSGRDGVCQPATEKWLHDNNVYYDHIFMRAMNDMRKDWVVKEEIFWNHVADNFNVHFVIDDRKQVVMNTWHPIGVKVIQVGNAYIDF